MMDTRQPAALLVLWRRWTKVVAWFAGRDPGRLRLDPAEYEALHRALLAACRALAQKADPGRAFPLDGLQQLVQPWITAASLEQADGELLADLLARCRVIDLELGGHGWLAPAPPPTLARRPGARVRRFPAAACIGSGVLG